MAAPTVEEHVDAFAVSRAALAAQAVAAAEELVNDFTDWYDTNQITALAASLVLQAQAAQRATAGVTDAYLSKVASQITKTRVRPAGVIDLRGGLRTGNVTHAGAYGRIADQYRWRITEGETPEVAQAGAVRRAAAVAKTDTDLAFRAMADKFMDERKADGYRRIIRPERSTEGTCGLCLVATDRVYSTDVLMALHNGCNCTVLPIMGDADPGHRLNRDDLKAIYAAAGGTERKKLQATRIVIREHGELGPVLTRAGDGFRDATQVRSDTREPRMRRPRALRKT